VVQPLVRWLWVGGMVMVVGTVLASVPDRRRGRSGRRRVRRREPAPAEAVGLSPPPRSTDRQTGADGSEEPAGVPVPVR